MSAFAIISAAEGPVTALDFISDGDLEAALAACDPLARQLAVLQDFRAQPGRVLMAPGGGGAWCAWVGLGARRDPWAAGDLTDRLPAGVYGVRSAPVGFDVGAALFAAALGAYRFAAYKSREARAVQFVAPPGFNMARAQRLWTAQCLVRDLVNAPANDLGAEALAEAALQVGAAGGARARVVVGDELLAQNYPLIHAVGRAAAQRPRYVELVWGEGRGAKLAIVGKGVTFDSGGLDIKTGGSSRLMKKDMGGAAHALALAQAVMDADLKVELSVHVPIVENAISGDSFRPGDIIRSRKGLSVEIDNTDAEGRLILADALARACELGPELVVDFATLTGAARVALGPDLPATYTDDDALWSELAAAGAAERDPLWRMPMWDAYQSELESPIADMKNSGGAMGGSITAALFLKRFVAAPSWVHMDVYSWNPKDRPGRPQGGDAQGLRAVYALLERRYS
jgi:leucyl aminopeptidase